jgi:phosphohistidine phosphatase SixA
MKLLFMRHASAEVNIRKSDWQRALTQEGKKEAEQAAVFLSDYRIDKMIVSYVNRTKETAAIIQQRIIVDELEEVTELYKGSLSDITELLINQENGNKNILIIGHNPLIYRSALSFIEFDTEIYEELIQSSMPPARVIVIDFPLISDWQDISGKKGIVSEVFTPALAS